MACDLRCPDCGDNFGKDTENPIMAFCGDCRIHIYNERGYSEDTPEEKEFIRKHKQMQRNSGWRTGRLIRRS